MTEAEWLTSADSDQMLDCRVWPTSLPCSVPAGHLGPPAGFPFTDRLTSTHLTGFTFTRGASHEPEDLFDYRQQAPQSRGA
jgi:hypothetical protein